MKYRLLFSLSIIFLCCNNRGDVYDNTDNIQDLGDNYYYLGDANESQILLNLKPFLKRKFGKTVIPGEVIAYNHNSQFIIAKTKNQSTDKKEVKYWILDKRIRETEPKSMDSIMFFKRIDSLNLNIDLKRRT